MDKLDMFQARFGKFDEFGWQGFQIFQTDSGSKFSSKESQEGLYVRILLLTLVAPYNQEIDDQFEVT